ncbi:MAG: hypothetical protein D6772_11615, partial [Bacteroidetes bacterium]
FRSYPPRAESSRIIPNLDDLLANRSDVVEVLPTYDRRLTFRCTVRDNNEEVGASVWADVAFRATSTAGPFLVLAPNSGNEEWRVGSYQEVRWDVANTNNELVDCQKVNILLSTDGGQTWPWVLLSDAPNTGSAFVTVPDAVGSRARIRVQAANNIFFDISNENFRISPAAEPTYTLDMSPVVQRLCMPATANVEFVTRSILGYDSLISLQLFSELPPGAVASFSAPTVLPGESATLMLDFTQVQDVNTRLPITVQATAPGQDTFYRTFLLDVVDNDFSDLALLEPADGTSGIRFAADFRWVDLPNVQEYDWRLSADPAFTEVFETQEAIKADSIRSTRFLEENTLYYWQVRPRNQCGTGEWTVPATLHSSFQRCEAIQSTNVPLNIPNTGPLPTIRSRVFVSESGTINDVNLPLVDISHSPIQGVDLTLVSPAQTRVTLYDGTCFSSGRLWIGFDDDAPDSIMCPPNEGVVFRPQQPLATFAGEEAQGEWTLEVKVRERGFSPGTVRAWGVEFCADVTPSQPSLLVNNPLAVPPGQANTITRSLLEVTDPEQSPDELYFTVLSLPEHGTLEFNGQALAIG